MKYIKKHISRFDKYILEIIAGFLLAFIPLYPKWPLADILPGYIVRLRLDDILVVLASAIWLVQFYRKKVSLTKNPLAKPIVIYILIGFLSSLSALFITKTVPLEKIHISKLFLHWLRRIEYMSLAFIFFSAIKTSKQLKRIMAILTFVVIAISIYGFGQKYFYWPVYSTMNREFSKGWRLVLTEHARVPSTFAGHYDFAAYLVVVLALTATFVLTVAKSTKQKIFYVIVYLLAFASLLLTASRTSFIAYLTVITVVIMLYAFSKGITWAINRWSIIIGISLIGMLFFGDLSQRFAHVLRINQFKEYLRNELSFITDITRKESVKVSEDLALVFTETDTPPTRYEVPPDVFENIPEAFPEATLAALTEEEKSKVASLAGKPRTYSEAAFTFGLSSAIRFDALWPRALSGFLKNPLFGSGYSTLVKTQTSEFTEAESTDNDYLRALGETGILGFLSFYAILAIALKQVWLAKSRIKDEFYLAIVIGIGGAIIGLMINGFYIDVFEASKVAYTFWALMGILFSTFELSKNKSVYAK